MRAYLQLPGAIYLLALGTVVNRAGTLIVPFLAIYLTQQLGLAPSFATQAVGLFGLGGIVAAVWGGHLADVVGRKVVMVGSLVGSAVLMMALSQAQSPAMVLLCVLVLATVGDMYRPASSALIADVVPEHQRTHAYSLIYVAVNLGFAMAPVIGGALARHAYSWLFLADAATSLLCAAIVAAGIREQRRAARTETSEDTAPPLRDALRHMMRNAPFVSFCSASLVLGIIYVQHISTLPIFARGAGILEDAFGRALGLNGIMVVLFQLPMASLIARFRKGTSMAMGALWVGAGFGLTMWVTNAWELAATIAVWTVGELLQSSLTQPLVSAMAPENMRGRYLGTAQMTFSMANMVGSPVGGYVLTQYGGVWLWGGCAALSVLACVLYLRVSRLLEH